jgi:hypothetical protein
MTGNNNHDEDSTGSTLQIKGVWMVRLTLILLTVDAIVSVIFMSPAVPWIHYHEGISSRYTFEGSLSDLLLLSMVRITAAALAFVFAFLKGDIRPETPFELYHPNGTKKTKEELEEEALEQSFATWFRRYMFRVAFPTEFLALLSTLLCVAKCLVRMNVEIGIRKDAEAKHPIFWCAILVSTICSVLEMSLCDAVSVRLGEWGHADRQNAHSHPGAGPSLLRQISSHLSLPLLANDGLQEETDGGGTEDEEQQQHRPMDDENAPGMSDIGGDTDYKASWSDLIHLCAPDTFLILVAFIFLLLAAAAQIYIPRFTGAILDALDEAYNKKHNGQNMDDDMPIHDVPGFMSNVRKLIIVSILGGVFSGVRGSIFTVVGGRVNVRLRLRLMDALLCMEQGFFDVTKTGDITSRLSSDTTLVGDQVTLNVNVRFSSRY